MRKLLRGLRNPVNSLAFLPVIFFLVLVQVLSQNTMAIITNGLDIGAGILLIIAYMPAWWKAVRRENWDRGDAFLSGGLLMIVGAILASRLWSQAIILMGKPAWMINHWFQSFCYVMVAVGMFYLLRVPGSKTSLKYMIYAGTISAVIIGTFLVYFLEQ